jgi:hypothetical protein
VFGVWPRGQHHGEEVRCQIFGERESGYELEQTVTIARFGWPVGIIDMDLSAERVVVARPLDFRSYWLLFDFRTGGLKSIGRTSDFGLFLREDVLESANPKLPA